MLLTNETHRAPASVVVLGMFDGVHRGHRALLIRGRELADAMALPLVVYTFEPHPLAILCPEKQPPRLTTLPERAGLMAGMGVDVFRVDAFTRAVAGCAPEAFLQQLMAELHPRAVVAGFNYTFGRMGRGDAALLERMGPELGYQAHIVPEVELAGSTVSSTRIRQLIEEGRLPEADVLLGRAYSLTGMPKGQGCRLTMAVPAGKVCPAPGTYSVLVRRGEHTCPAVVQMLPQGQMHIQTKEALPPEGRLRIVFCE